MKNVSDRSETLIQGIWFNCIKRHKPSELVNISEQIEWIDVEIELKFIFVNY